MTRRRVLWRLAAVVVALAPLTGCGLGGPDPIGLTGTWEGEIYDAASAAASRYPVEMRLRDNGQRVTGSGEVQRLPEGSLLFTVTDGSFVNAIVNLQLQFAEAPFSGSLSGTLVETSPGRIRGTFSGRGAANGEVEIRLVAR